MKISPKISIIIPVYNCEKYLHRCLDSILVQTFRDWECILIDDGSTDLSGKILDDYTEKDQRFIVFHKANGGVSSARNYGLDIANGDYIVFIDADDYVSKTYLQHLLYGISNDSDLSVSFSIKCNGFGDSIKEIYNGATLTPYNYDRLFTDFDFAWHTSPWGKMYKKSIIEIKHLRFDEHLNIGEDLYFLYSYILNSSKIQITSFTDYYYFYNNSNSLTKKTYSLDIEMYTYKQISSIIYKLIDEFNFNSAAITHIMWTKASYCRRVLNALYDNKTNKTLRLNILNTIDIQTYCMYINTSSRKEQLYIYLLNRGYYKSHDALRYYIKYFKSKLCLFKLWSIQ